VSVLLQPAWIDLAQPRLGSRVVFATDEFFGAKERLIDPAEPVFHPDRYDDHGKWMDGWETRRRRGPGNDHCILRLGRPGIVEALEIDTRHFTGNYPPAAAIALCDSESEIPGPDAAWVPATPMLSLEGDTRQRVELGHAMRASHVRLDIYPDGGVARLRVLGRAAFDAAAGAGPLDLAAMENGCRVLAVNDAHFGAPANLVAPGPAAGMHDGWETRRRREPGFDWAILALACRGRIEEVLADTAFFKGNYPDRLSLQAADTPGLPAEALVAQSQFWPELLGEQPLDPDREHRFSAELADLGPVSHVRLNIFPDGGIARLRLFGRVDAG